MKSSKKKLSPKQLKALELIMSGMTMRDVAEKIGVVRQTVSEWKNHDALFMAQLDQLQADAKEELRYSAPMRELLMMSQFCELACEGPHETRLKAVLAYFDRFHPKTTQMTTATGLGEADAFILRVMQDRHAQPARGESNIAEHGA